MNDILFHPRIVELEKTLLVPYPKPDDIEERINTWDILHFRPGINKKIKIFQNGRVETFFISERNGGAETIKRES